MKETAMISKPSCAELLRCADVVLVRTSLKTISFIALSGATALACVIDLKDLTNESILVKSIGLLHVYFEFM